MPAIESSDHISLFLLRFCFVGILTGSMVSARILKIFSSALMVSCFFGAENNF